MQRTLGPAEYFGGEGPKPAEAGRIYCAKAARGNTDNEL
jgi:hypothetical protein